MSDSNKISLRLSPALQAALTAHVRQHGGHTSDVVREALEAYLGLRPTKRPPGRPGIAPETLQAIAAARARLPTLSLPQLARHLFEAGIYRATGKDGQARPVAHSRLRRWLRRLDAEAAAEAEPPA